MKRRRTVVHFHDEDWQEAKHPRGQPKNAGQFATVAGGGSSAGGGAAKARAEPAPKRPSKADMTSTSFRRGYTEGTRGLPKKSPFEGDYLTNLYEAGHEAGTAAARGRARLLAGQNLHIHVVQQERPNIYSLATTPQRQTEPGHMPPGREQLHRMPKLKGGTGGAAKREIERQRAMYEGKTANDVLERFSEADRKEMADLFAKDVATTKAKGGDTRKLNTAGVAPEHRGRPSARHPEGKLIGERPIYTTARRKVQNGILLDKFFTPSEIERARAKPGETPTMTFLGGRGGSGKSSLRDLAYSEAHALVLDSDTIKALLPEYEGWNAGFVHEESSDVLDRALALARRMKLNVVLDATMKSWDGIEKKMAAFADEGYDLYGHYMLLPEYEASARSVDRYFSPRNKPGAAPTARGRLVNPAIIFSNKNNEENFDRAADRFKGWTIWHNNVPQGSPPALVAHGGVDEVEG